jgi:hypothetical protein
MDITNVYFCCVDLARHDLVRVGDRAHTLRFSLRPNEFDSIDSAFRDAKRQDGRRSEGSAQQSVKWQVGMEGKTRATRSRRGPQMPCHCQLLHGKHLKRGKSVEGAAISGI